MTTAWSSVAEAVLTQHESRTLPPSLGREKRPPQSGFFHFTFPSHLSPATIPLCPFSGAEMETIQLSGSMVGQWRCTLQVTMCGASSGPAEHHQMGPTNTETH